MHLYLATRASRLGECARDCKGRRRTPERQHLTIRMPGSVWRYGLPQATGKEPTISGRIVEPTVRRGKGLTAGHHRVSDKQGSPNLVHSSRSSSAGLPSLRQEEFRGARNCEVV